MTKWVDIAGINEQTALKYLSTYLSGKAAMFYMIHMARLTLVYMLESLFCDLFEYCFPLNFRRKL